MPLFIRGKRNSRLSIQPRQFFPAPNAYTPTTCFRCRCHFIPSTRFHFAYQIYTFIFYVLKLTSKASKYTINKTCRYLSHTLHFNPFILISLHVFSSFSSFLYSIFVYIRTHFLGLLWFCRIENFSMFSCWS